MAIAPSDLEKAALDLEPELRARLATLLISSLEEAADVDAQEIEQIWLAEADERCRQIDAGEAKPLSAAEVIAQLRRRR